MELLFGIHVREHGYRIGRLAGVEVERGTQQVRSIFFSADGDMGSHAESRPLAAVPVDHFAGDIVLRAFQASAEPTTGEPLVLSRATRLVRSGHPIGRLVGVEVSPGRHIVRFKYSSYSHYPVLLAIGALTLLGLALYPRRTRARALLERRSRRRPRTHRDESARADQLRRRSAVVDQTSERTFRDDTS